MVERKYLCNFCRKEKDVDNLIGIYWGNRGGMEQRWAAGVENHLCYECINEIQKLQIDLDKENK